MSVRPSVGRSVGHAFVKIKENRYFGPHKGQRRLTRLTRCKVASKKTSKEASKQENKQGSKQARKQGSKELSKEGRKQGSKLAGKQGSIKEASIQSSNQSRNYAINAYARIVWP